MVTLLVKYLFKIKLNNLKMQYCSSFTSLWRLLCIYCLKDFFKHILLGFSPAKSKPLCDVLDWFHLINKWSKNLG